MITKSKNSGSIWSKWIKILFGKSNVQLHSPDLSKHMLNDTMDTIFESEVKGFLRKVIDPELEINIVDLGLIYKIEQDDENRIFVEMTLSTPACPIGDVIVQNVLDTLENAYPSKQVDVRLVFDPPWHPGMLSEFGRQALQGKI